MELNELQYRRKIRDIIIIASTGHPKFTIAISCRKEPPVVLLMLVERQSFVLFVYIYVSLSDKFAVISDFMKT